jgi:hypothetical protein
MDTIQPWLDPIEVRRLADRLMNTNREPGLQHTQSAGNDEGFVDYAATQPPASQPPFPVEPTAAPHPKIQFSASGPLLERLNGFRAWLHEHFSASEVFILDHKGAVLFDESGHGRLHFIARSVAISSHRPEATVGNVHMKISAGTSVEIIPVNTPDGCIVLGAVLPNPLDPAAVNTVMDALAQAAAPVGS